MKTVIYAACLMCGFGATDQNAGIPGFYQPPALQSYTIFRSPQPPISGFYDNRGTFYQYQPPSPTPPAVIPFQQLH